MLHTTLFEHLRTVQLPLSTVPSSEVMKPVGHFLQRAAAYSAL